MIYIFAQDLWCRVRSPIKMQAATPLKFYSNSNDEDASTALSLIMSNQDTIIVPAMQYHDDVIKWGHFPRHWPFVRGIHRSPVNSSHKGQWRGAFMFSLICVWINGWVKQSWSWRFETLSRPLWRHCDAMSYWTVLYHYPINTWRPCQNGRHVADSSIDSDDGLAPTRWQGII